METNLYQDLVNHIGRTITIYTESGGTSGSGFTGVLTQIDCRRITLLVSIGAAPTCAVGSPCNCGFNPCCNNNFDQSLMANGIGSVIEIPICHIVAVIYSTI